MGQGVKLEKVAEEWLGMSPRHYRRLSLAGVVPPVVKGEIDLLLAFKMLLAYYRKMSEGKGIDGLITARKDNLQLKNDLLVMEKLVRTGELIPREEVLQEFLARIRIVKEGLLNLDRILPHELVGKDYREMEDIIRKHTIQLMRWFQRQGGVLKQKQDEGEGEEKGISPEGEL